MAGTTPIRVFISSSRRDREAVDRVAAVLRSAGFDLAADRPDITAGQDFAAVLARAMAEADVVVFALSENSVASEASTFDIGRAGAAQKPILPVIVGAFERRQVPDPILRRQWLPRSGGAFDAERDGPELVEAVQRLARESNNSIAADDLKLIRGVGVLIEKRLNDLGVRRFADIAAWTDEDVQRISTALDFKGRIESENWVEQARILAAGGQTEFSRRAGRDETGSLPASATGRTRTLFLAYSRADREQAQALELDLRRRGFEVWVDVDGIRGGERWKDRLSVLIRDADAVLFLVSPRLVGSEVCAWEVSEAYRHSRRIVPVLIADLGDAAMPDGLRVLHHVPLRPVDDRAEGLRSIVEALDHPDDTRPRRSADARVDSPTPAGSYVFVSCTEADRDTARRLMELLRGMGLDVRWADDDVLRRGRFEAQVFDAIRGSGAVLALLSPEAAKSSWFAAEAMGAKREGKLVCAEIGAVLRSELTHVFSGQMLHDLRPGSDIDERVAFVAKVLAETMSRTRRAAATAVPTPGVDAPTPPTPQPPPSQMAQPAEAGSTAPPAAEFVKLEQLQRIVALGRALCTVRLDHASAGATAALGVLVRGGDLHPDLDNGAGYVLVSLSAVAPVLAGPLGMVRAVFDPSGDGMVRQYGISRIIWRSPAHLCDAVLLALDAWPEGIVPVPLATLLFDYAAPGAAGEKVLVVGTGPGETASLLAGNAEAQIFGAVAGRTRFAPEIIEFGGATEAYADGSLLVRANLFLRESEPILIGLVRSRPADGYRPRATRSTSIATSLGSIRDSIARALDLHRAAAVWDAGGRGGRGLASARRVAEIEMQLAAEPVEPWIEDVVTPFLAASRDELSRAVRRRRFAAAAVLALAPLVGAIALERWIGGTSITLSSAATPQAGRIARFLAPEISARGTAIADLVISDDGALVATLDASDVVRLWETATGKLRWAQPLALEPGQHGASLAFAAERLGFPRRVTVAVATPQGLMNTLSSWIEIESGKVQRQFAPEPETYSLLNFDSARPAGHLTLTVPRPETPEGGKLGTGIVQAATDRGDGRFVAVRGGTRGTVDFYQGGSGSFDPPDQPHSAAVLAAAMAPDGRRAATGAADGGVVLWQRQIAPGAVVDFATRPGAETPREAWTATRLGGEPTLDDARRTVFSAEGLTLAGVALSPDGRRFAFVDSEGGLRLFDLETRLGTVSVRGIGIGLGATPVAFSPDGTLLAIGGRSLTVVNAVTGQKLAEITPGGEAGREVAALAWSPEGQILAIASFTLTATEVGIVQLIDVATRQPISAGVEAPVGVRSLEFTPDGQGLLALGNLTVASWRVRRNAGRDVTLGRLDEIAATAATFAPDGRLVVARPNGRVDVIRLAAAGAGARQNGSASAPTRSAGSPTEAETVDLMIGGSTSPVTVLHMVAPFTAVFGRQDGTVTAVQRIGASPVTRSLDGRSFGLHGTTPVKAARLLPDGRHAVSAGGDGRVLLWNTFSGAEVATLPARVGELSDIRISPDGRNVVIVASGSVQVVPISGNVCGGPCTSAVFSSDGAWLATAGLGGRPRIDWATAGGQRFTVLDHGAAVNVVRFRGPPRRDATGGAPVMQLVTGGDDGTVKLWSYAPASAPEDRRSSEVRRLATIRGHEAAITHAAVTPDGRRLVTADIQGGVRMADLDAAIALGAIDPTEPFERVVLPPVGAAVGWASAALRSVTAVPLSAWREFLARREARVVIERLVGRAPPTLERVAISDPRGAPFGADAVGFASSVSDVGVASLLGQTICSRGSDITLQRDCAEGRVQAATVEVGHSGQGWFTLSAKSGINDLLVFGCVSGSSVTRLKGVLIPAFGLPQLPGGASTAPQPGALGITFAISDDARPSLTVNPLSIVDISVVFRGARENCGPGAVSVAPVTASPPAREPAPRSPAAPEPPRASEPAAEPAPAARSRSASPPRPRQGEPLPAPLGVPGVGSGGAGGF